LTILKTTTFYSNSFTIYFIPSQILIPGLALVCRCVIVKRVKFVGSFFVS